MLGELALYSFVLLLLTGTFLSLFYVASPETSHLHRALRADARDATVSLAYDSVMRHLVRGAGRARDAPDPPLVGADVHGRDGGAPGARVLHGRVPQAARDELDDRRHAAREPGSAPGSPATRCPMTCCREPGCASSTRRCCRSRSIGTWLAYLFFGGEFPAPELVAQVVRDARAVDPRAASSGLLSAHLALVWRQTHTQFPGPGTTEETVTGTPVWPKFALKAIGLAFVTFGVLTMLGGLVQINPIWLYGPFVPYSGAVAGPARLLCRLAGGTAAAVAQLGVPRCSVTRSGSCSCPRSWCRASSSPCSRCGRSWRLAPSATPPMHHYAQRPREAPVRSAFGAGGHRLLRAADARRLERRPGASSSRSRWTRSTPC